jgi:hypothetical protein
MEVICNGFEMSYITSLSSSSSKKIELLVIVAVETGWDLENPPSVSCPQFTNVHGACPNSLPPKLLMLLDITEESCPTRQLITIFSPESQLISQ